MEELPSLLIALGLILLNGAFVSAEFAIARVRRTQIDYMAKSEPGTEFDKGTIKRAQQLQIILDHINDYISACQVGITISSLALGAFAEAKIEHLISPWVEMLPFNLGTQSISIILALGIITFFHVILGEIVPKNVAIINPDKMALFFSPFLAFIHGIFQAPVYVLNQCSNLCLAAIGIEADDAHTQVHSEAELKMILSTSQEEGILEEDEEQLIQNVFEFNDTVARDIMIPRTDMFCISDEISIAEAIKEANKTCYSRFPLYHKRLDNITGYVSIKDMLVAVDEGKTASHILSISNEVLKVPDGMYIMDLIQLMQSKKKPFAILIDEFGGTSGLATAEDIVEEIFGEIEDENEVGQAPITHFSNGDFLIDGLVTLKDLNEELGLNFESDHYDTIGGFTFGLIGAEPKPGDQVEYEGYSLLVEEHSNNRVRKVRISKK